MQYRDVVIHTNAGIFGKEEDLKNFPYVQERVELSDQIWLGRLDPDTARTIMETCEPKTVGVRPPARQFAQLYSFVRELPSHDDIYRWDHDNELVAAVALSRLIHPTSTGFAYAARIRV